MASSVSSAVGAMDPLLQQYYGMQSRNAYDTYQMGLSQNSEQKALSDLSYQQKLAALQDRLTQEGNALPNSFASRGLMNSGIWNYNGAGQLGAKQQFAYDSALSQNNLNSQANMLDKQFGQRAIQLGTTYQDTLSGIKTQQAVDQGRQAVNDAIMGA